MEESLRGLKTQRRLAALSPIVVIAVLIAGGLMAAIPTRAGNNNNLLLAYVDIGEDETMADLYGWGPVEPDTNPGTWGGYGVADSPLYGQKTRVMWYEDMIVDGQTVYDPNGRFGEVKVNFVGSARTLAFDHLDGIANDSFNLYAVGDYGPVLIFSYIDFEPVSDVETWITETVDLSKYIGCELGPIYVGGCQFKLIFEATCELNADNVPWWGWATWGSVAIDNILVWGNGVEVTQPTT